MTEQNPPQPPYGQQPPGGGYPQQYGGPPPKKSHTLRNILLVLVVLFVLGVGGCLAIVGVAGNSIDKSLKAGSADHTVVYKVGGTTTKADLTYTTDGSTSTEQKQGQKVPWMKKLNIPGDFLQVYQVSAQNTGKGTVTCEILVDGKSVKKASSKGFAAIASCDYSP